ncbi:helix-turn-helix domain-containing protein [Lihuaxuella thermophila]|uniref:Anaphase-promoting complex subunit 5 n=1 Tax=Lihuaxuella thermophila TaxID=1173111 RepID=A0A1H8H2G8_9BACL|nr:tetratricopeptide repeat protein [Lihuaxuella thermophila]SEN50209.1 Anaphase-promoting complex subunit 5 [Lihuaxuella thermophila]
MDFEKVGKLIRKVRKERHLRQEDLSDEHIPRTTLSAIERGLCQNPVKVQYILRKLDIDLSELSDLEKEKEEDRNLYLLILENKANSKPRDTLSELSRLPAEYKGPHLDFLKGVCFYNVEQYDRAADYFHRALQLLEKTTDHERTNLKACCLTHLSVIAFIQHGHKEKALRYVEEALKIFDLDGQRRYYYINLLTNKAIFLRSLGRPEEALKTLDEIKIDSLEINIGAAIGVYVLKAKLKKDIKLYDSAADCAKKGLEIARINYNHEREVELYITLADIYRESGKLHRAEQCLRAAIDLKEKISRRQWLILEARLRLGIVYIEKKDYPLAREILEKTKKIAKRENNMVQYSQALLSIGKVFLSEAKYEEARAAFAEACTLHSDEHTNLEALHGLMQAYLFLGDETNYIKYSKLYYKAKGLYE